MPRWEGLEEVVAIADAGTFVGAARRLDVSPSHISRVVAQMEAHVGTRLFDRTTRSVRLTEAGRSLVDQGRRLLEEYDEAVQFVSQRGEMRGELRMTCSIALGEKFVAPIVRRFMEKNPGITVMMEFTNRVIDLVGEGFDIGIRTGHPSDARLAARQIASRSVDTCASPGYLARYGMPKHPSALGDHNCLIGTTNIWHFQEEGQRVTFVPSGRWRCNSGVAVVDAAVAGMGVCQLPAFYLLGYLATGELVRILADYQDAAEAVWAVYPQRRYLVPKVRGMIDLLQQELVDLIP